MTKLSVNINKIAVVRNSRGGNRPDVVRAALDIERFGADGITVHPRPDARHIRYDDVRALKRVLATEFNIEGNPIDSFVALVEEVRPTQVTLVPDAADAVTSNAGWNTVAHLGFLQTVCERFKRLGIRVSIFVDPVAEMVRGAAACGADRVELFHASPVWQRGGDDAGGVGAVPGQPAPHLGFRRHRSNYPGIRHRLGHGAAL